MSEQRILAIDDEPAVLGLCERVLSREGFSVKGTPSAQAGLRLIADQRWNLVLLDVRLPDGDGLEMLAEIRVIASETPVILVTGHATMEVAINALKSGAQDFLRKPFTPQELITSVQRVLERERLLRENVRLKARLPILEIGKALISETDPARLMHLALHRVQQELRADRVSLMLLDEEHQELYVAAAIGLDNDLVANTRVKVGEGIAGLAAQKREPLLASGRGTRDDGIPASPLWADVGSAICVPLLLQNRVLGVLNVGRAQDTAPLRQDDVDLLAILCGQIAVALENARLFGQAQQEIAERERAEEALERERNFVSAVLDTAGALVVVLDRQGRIVRFNRACEHMTGYAFHDVRGKYLWDMLLAPHEIETVKALFEDLQSDHFPDENEHYWVTRDGRWRLITWENSTLLDEQGTVEYVICTGIDVTVRRQAEAALKRRTEELTALNVIAATISQSIELDSILTATLRKVLDIVGLEAGWIQLLDTGDDGDTLVLASHHGISDRSARTLSRVHVEEGLTGKAARPDQAIPMSRVTDDPRICMQVLRQEDAYAFADVPIQARDRVLGVLALFGPRSRDLTEREAQLLTAIGHQIGMAVENVRLVEQASELEILRELDRLRSELIANVSHELRTPLGLIKVFCTTLLRRDIDFEPQTLREFLLDIEDETERLEQIVTNLLDMSRAESGRLTLDTHPTDLGQLVAQVTAGMEIQLRNHHVVHDFPAEPLIATVDPRQMEQVLRNLLSNAHKYSPNASTITLRGRGDKRQILLQIRDQGIGIPEGELERIFERFYRVENETTQKIGGVGLGLAVCRSIVHAHGGRIWAESEPGKGSTFCLALPKTSRPEPGTERL
jgi:PAS domain S-box-containing protein